MNHVFSMMTRIAQIACLLVVFTALQAQDDPAPYRHTATVRTVPDSVVSKMKKQNDFLYANDPSYWKKQRTEQRSGLDKLLMWLGRSGVMTWILYIFLAVLVIFVLYQVLAANGFKIFTPRKRKIKSVETFTEEETENIEGLIASAIEQMKFREATRYLYLKTLQSLSAGKLITIQAKATNKDYIFQLSGTAKSKDFGRLTTVYEYVWYGEFHPDDRQFMIINDQFNEFISQI